MDPRDIMARLGATERVDQKARLTAIEEISGALSDVPDGLGDQGWRELIDRTLEGSRGRGTVERMADDPISRDVVEAAYAIGARRVVEAFRQASRVANGSAGLDAMMRQYRRGRNIL
jgi:hypothetical protein